MPSCFQRISERRSHFVGPVPKRMKLAYQVNENARYPRNLQNLIGYPQSQSSSKQTPSQSLEFVYCSNISELKTFGKLPQLWPSHWSFVNFGQSLAASTSFSFGDFAGESQIGNFTGESQIGLCDSSAPIEKADSRWLESNRWIRAYPLGITQFGIPTSS